MCILIRYETYEAATSYRVIDFPGWLVIQLLHFVLLMVAYILGSDSNNRASEQRQSNIQTVPG